MIDSFILIFVGATILASLAMVHSSTLNHRLRPSWCCIGTACHGLDQRYGIGHLKFPNLAFCSCFLLLVSNSHRNMLVTMFGTSLVAALLSSVLFFSVGLGAGLLFGFTWVECIVLGTSLTFSSTVLGIKLLPRTILHHRRTGELVFGILLIQDLIAVADTSRSLSLCRYWRTRHGRSGLVDRSWSASARSRLSRP